MFPQTKRINAFARALQGSTSGKFGYTFLKNKTPLREEQKKGVSFFSPFFKYFAPPPISCPFKLPLFVCVFTSFDGPFPSTLQAFEEIEAFNLRLQLQKRKVHFLSTIPTFFFPKIRLVKFRILNSFDYSDQLL